MDAGRAYELVRRDDPDNLTLKGVTVDIATKLHYDPLINRDAAEWYVRDAAGAYANDPARGAAAKALLLKLELEDADVAHLAQDGDADATLNAAAAPSDAEALLEQVDADIRAYLVTKDTRYRSLALLPHTPRSRRPFRSRSFRTIPGSRSGTRRRRRAVGQRAIATWIVRRRRPCFRTRRRPRASR